jgi:RHS repeat-associated protein
MTLFQILVSNKMKVMKTKILLIILLFINCYNIILGQVSTSITLNTSLTGTQDKIASSWILLNSGFCYTNSTGNYFLARAGLKYVDPVSAALTGGPGGTIGDIVGNDGVVGAIDGSYSVSSTGAAIYNIPIECPSGINGMNPSPSLVYSSQTGNGIAGWGWNIGGLSAISRASNTYYYDNNTTGISWGTSDNFQLDGKRLIISIKYPSGTAIANADSIDYLLDSDPTVKIRGYDYNVMGPGWFKVWTNGKVMDYKQYMALANQKETNSYGTVEYPDTYSVDSVVTIDKRFTLNWYLTSVTDNFGNKIHYKYEYDSTLVSSSPGYGYYYADDTDYSDQLDEVDLTEGDYYLYIENVINQYTYKNFKLKEISYAGGADRILFNYENRSDNVVGYINGKQSLNEKRLSTVSVLSQSGNQLRKYTLEYSKDSADFYSKLIKLNLAGSNGESFNSTVFDWERTEYSYYKSGTYSFAAPSTYTTRISNGWNFNVVTSFPADFNGDGVTDFLGKYHYSKGGKYEDDWATFINDGTVTSLDCSGTGKIPDNKKFYLFDQDLDGKTELYLQSAYTKHLYNEDSTVTYAYPCVKFSGYEYNGTSVVHDENLDFEFYLSSGTSADDVVLLHADFNGDGKQECFLLDNNLKYQNNKGLTLYSTPDFGTSKNYFLCDFNGNGKPEIVFLKSNKIEFWEYSSTGMSLILSNSNFNNLDYFYPGDFNGDGNQDILVYDRSASLWKILTSTGSNMLTTLIQPPSLKTSTFNQYNYAISDFNQDGKSDIIQVYPNYIYSNGVGFATDATMSIYISNGSNFNLTFTKVDAPLISLWFEGEANQDLTTDFFGDFNEPVYYSISKGKGFNQINKIYTGIGQEINFTYQRNFSNNERKISITDQNEDLPHLLSTPLLTKTTATITCGNTTNSYEFSNPVLCAKGAWFMGFANVTNTVTKGTLQMLTWQHFSSISRPNYRYDFLPDSLVTRINGNDVSYSSSHYSSFYSAGKYFIVPGKSVSYDFLNSVKVQKEFKGYDSYLYPSVIITKNYAGSSSEAEQTDSLTYTHTTSSGCWRIGELTNKRTIQKRTGETNYRRVWNYDYYSNGALKTEYLQKGTTKELKKSYEYDNFGNILKLSTVTANDANDSRVRETTMTYSSDGRFITSKTDILGNTETYSYNTITGNLSSRTDANNLTTSFTYDGFDRLKKTVYPDNTESSTAYCWSSENSDAPGDACFYLYKKQSGVAPEIVFYDKYGKDLRSVTTGFTGETIYTDKEYDTADRLLQESLPYISSGTALWKVNAYDSYGRISSITDPDGSVLSYSYGQRQTSTTLTMNSSSQITTKKFNSMGEAIESIDNGGNSVYTKYYASGLPKEIQVEGQSQKTSFTYDIYGNRTLISDPDAGDISSVYNALGYLVSQTDNKNNTSSFTYDKSGRTLTKTIGGVQTSYIYDTQFKGAVSSVANSTNSISNAYDNLGRLSSQTETFTNSGVNKTLTTSYTYDSYGRTLTKAWSTGYNLTYEYNSYGDLSKISNGNTVIWNGTGQNALGQFTGYSQGAYSTTVAYNSYGDLSQVTTSGVRNMKYVFDNFKNLSSREDLLSNQKEIFAYDNLNRLSAVNYYLNNVHITSADKTISYNNYGNIVGKSGLADSIFYGENGYGPHAVTSVWNTGTYSPLNQSISYTAFNKAETITDTLSDGTLRKMQYVYGLDQQRRESIYTEGSTTKTKYYFGDYEEVTEGTSTKKYFYIDTPTGLAGIYVIDGSGTGALNYMFNDHLGSITEVINTTTGLITYQSFDAWGNPRSASSWIDASATALFADRGFTGHEHLEAFSLINMNGRMYDPVLGRFLSPDPFVQMPDFSQKFNRYGYCNNNPLVYTDPDGNNPLIIGALIVGAVTGTINLATHWHNVHNFWDGAAAFGIGFGAGFVGTITFGACLPAGAALGAGGYMAGAYASGASYLTSSTIQSIGNAAYFGDPMPTSKELLSGIVSSMAIGGTIQGINAVVHGRNFWTGNIIKRGRGAFSFTNLPKQSNDSPIPTVDPISGNDLLKSYNASYCDQSELKLPAKLYHYTYEDPSEWTQLGLKEGGLSYLTPDAELSKITSALDLDLPQGVSSWRIEITTSDPNFNLSNIEFVQRVQGNLYGHGGGGWEIVYKGIYQPGELYKFVVTKVW